ncbi:hypothetical protein ACTUM2_15640, partial [Listeria monocytogenes]
VAGSVTHADQDELSAAMRASKKREVSDSWVLNRKKADEDISPFVGGTLALYGVTMPKVKRPKIGERGRR